MSELHNRVLCSLAESLDRFENGFATAEVAVTLTPNDVNLAVSHALLRRTEKLQGKRGDRAQNERSTWDNELEGACAEMAWCKHLGVFWSGVSDLRATDGGGVEVRWTKHATGGLIVYPQDSDDSVYVLAKGFAPHFRFVGWLTGKEAKSRARQVGNITVVDGSLLKAMNDG